MQIVLRSRQEVDVRDFIHLHKWVNEVERSGHELAEMDNRLNRSIGQDVLLATLQTVVSGALPPSVALLLISRWLNSGHVQAVETELTKQYQLV